MEYLIAIAIGLCVLGIALISLKILTFKKQIITPSILEQRKEMKTKIENLMVSQGCDLEFYRRVDKTMIDLIVNTTIKSGGQNGGISGNN